MVSKIAVRDASKARTVELPAELVTTNLDDLVTDDSIDMVVELIGGIDRAFELVKAALENGKAVVTGNKALLAERGQELFAIAESEWTTHLLRGGSGWRHFRSSRRFRNL